MTPAQLINQTSGKFEYYTPQPIVEAARRAMGGIDLDPASSKAANERVQARHFYTEQVDGLSKNWFGNVWMNHPFGRQENPRWISKMIGEYDNGNIEQACCITYACTSEQWFQPLAKFPQCYLAPRTNYYLPDGEIKKGVTKGSVVTFLPPGYNDEMLNKFCSAFRGMGTVKVTA